MEIFYKFVYELFYEFINLLLLNVIFLNSSVLFYILLSSPSYDWKYILINSYSSYVSNKLNYLLLFMLNSLDSNGLYSKFYLLLCLNYYYYFSCSLNSSI